jgi:hypothetical protein
VSDSSNPVMTYLKIRAEFTEARGKVVEAAKVVQKVAAALQTIPPSLFFSSCEVGALVEIGGPGTPATASAQDWSSAAELQRLVNGYYELRNRLQQAWSDVPAKLRDGLEAPNRHW